MDKKTAIIWGVCLACGLGIGWYFRGKLVVPIENYAQAHSTNWYLAIPVFAMLMALVVIGYLFDRRIGK